MLLIRYWKQKKLKWNRKSGSELRFCALFTIYCDEHYCSQNKLKNCDEWENRKKLWLLGAHLQSNKTTELEINCMNWIWMMKFKLRCWDQRVGIDSTWIKCEIFEWIRNPQTFDLVNREIKSRDNHVFFPDHSSSANDCNLKWCENDILRHHDGHCRTYINQIYFLQMISSEILLLFSFWFQFHTLAWHFHRSIRRFGSLKKVVNHFESKKWGKKDKFQSNWRSLNRKACFSIRCQFVDSTMAPGHSSFVRRDRMYSLHLSVFGVISTISIWGWFSFLVAFHFTFFFYSWQMPFE